MIEHGEMPNLRLALHKGDTRRLDLGRWSVHPQLPNPRVYGRGTWGRGSAYRAPGDLASQKTLGHLSHSKCSLNGSQVDACVNILRDIAYSTSRLEP